MPRLTKVEQYREKNFMTLEDLAERADIDVTTAWKACHARNVSVTTAKKLAEAFGVEPSKLL